MSMSSKGRRDVRKARTPKRQPIDRRAVLHNAIRAGERAARNGSDTTVPEIYAGDHGQTVAWLCGHNNVTRARGAQ